jgi:ketosteroid isomerase-like protein
MATTKEQNINIVQNGVNEFIKGNIPGMLDACADDIVWITSLNPDLPFAKIYKGKTAAGQFFKDLGSNVDFSEFSPGKYYGDDDMVFVKMQQAATVKKPAKNMIMRC